MNHGILAAENVSDGIMVSFAEGLICYYSSSFLLAHAGMGSNMIFLDHDPSGSHDLLPLKSPPFVSDLMAS